MPGEAKNDVKNDVQHDAGAHRFYVRLPEGLAYLAYAPAGGNVIDVQHTFVPEEAEGQGVGSALATAAFAYAREHGLRVVPTCPYVSEWLGRHREVLDLVVSAGE